MQTISIDPNQGVVSVDLLFPTPQVTTYRLQIFKPNSNDLLLDVTGNNQNTDDDTYALPMPPSGNTGCLLWCTATTIDPQGAGNNYQVQMAVSQADATTGVKTQLGVVDASGTTTATHVTNILTATLA